MEHTISVTIHNFSLEDTLLCGQCFRFKKIEDNIFTGVIGNHSVKLTQCDSTILAVTKDLSISIEELSSFFALDVDYSALHLIFNHDPTLKKILEFSPGIRVLRQPLFETLISFIISQNNNIGRISRIIETLCSSFGEKIDDSFYTFPEPSVLASLTSEDLAPLRCGFRDKYILDASRKWASGELIEEIIYYGSLNESVSELTRINGVGPKVASCVLLFGASRFDAFPEDVWIKRAMKELFPEGLPSYVLPYAGIAQQYIYHYARRSLF